MRVMRHRLAPPETAEEWEQYHRIRRTVLWERRGLLETYDERHPDEHRPGHHPLLLTFDLEPIGVVRVDVDGRTASFRRVAVREDVQRQGHGRVLLDLAEAFARRQGCSRLQSAVASDAVSFYEKWGVVREAATTADTHHDPKRKIQ
jgi:GNAT superfamily N-acetyltransferase